MPRGLKVSRLLIANTIPFVNISKDSSFTSREKLAPCRGPPSVDLYDLTVTYHVLFLLDPLVVTYVLAYTVYGV